MTKNSNYIDWLSQHMSPDSLQKHLDYYTCIGDFCTERGILTRPLLETTNQGAIDDVLITIKHNKVFQSLYYESAKEMWDAVVLYSDYLQTHKIHLADEIHNASERDPHQFEFWSQLYIEVCSSLLDYDPDSFAYLKGGSLFCGDRPEFGTASTAKKMTHPVEIDKNYFIETSFSTSEIPERIIELFELCDVGDPDVLFPGILASLNISPEKYNSKGADTDDQIYNNAADESAPSAFINTTTNNLSTDSENHLINWERLYIEVCSSLLEYDPESFAYLKGGSLFSGDRPEFGTASAAKKMTHPVEIGKDYYIETSFDNSVIVKRIIELFEFCAVDDPDILFPGILSSLNITPEENNSIQADSDDQLDNPSDWIRDECDPNRESEYEDAELEEELMSEDNSSHYSDAPYVFSSIPTLDKETEGIPAEPQDSVFDQPISFSFFGSQYHVSSWSGLYVQICKLLHEDYPVAFENLEGCALLSGGQIEFGNEQDSYQMKYPEEIAENFFIETNFSDAEIRRRVDILLYYCDINPANIQIAYNNSDKHKLSDHSPLTISEPAADYQAEYLAWLKKTFKNGSSLIKTFKECSDYAREKGWILCEFWETDDIPLLKNVYGQLLTALFASGFTARKRNQYKESLSMYIQWLETKQD